MRPVTGYVDTASALCQDVRAHGERYRDVAEFMRAHGYHPGQCQLSSGQLKDDRAVIMEYAKRMHLAGFNLHFHVIGDRAARTAIDAIEAARAADGVSTTRDSLAHLQFVQPDDIVRLGRDHLYIAYTLWWATSYLDYDMTVAPFVQHVTGNSYARPRGPLEASTSAVTRFARPRTPAPSSSAVPTRRSALVTHSHSSISRPVSPATRPARCRSMRAKRLRSGTR